MTSIDLKGKSILVTGASRGIGKECARYLLEMGARVALHYNANKKSAKELLSSYESTNSKIYKADLEIESEVIELIKEVIKEFGKLDAIVLNAGVSLEHSIDDPLESWLSTWNKTLKINLTSVGILTKMAIDHFKDSGGGRLVYIGSRAAFRGETEEYLAYAASKGGMTSLARSVARSFGKENIKAFVVAPGFTRTQMAKPFIEKHGEQRVLDEISLNELTKPEDISPLIALMCSGLMDHATGATIDVNAGSHIR